MLGEVDTKVQEGWSWSLSVLFLAGGNCSGNMSGCGVTRCCISRGHSRPKGVGVRCQGEGARGANRSCNEVAGGRGREMT